MRIEKPSSLLPGVKRGRKIQIIVDGNPIDAYEGETIAAALLAAGIAKFHLSGNHKQPRGLYCGMGICYECLVRVNGVDNVRACMTPAADGMTVETCREVEL